MAELTLHAKADHAYEPADGVSRVCLTVKVRLPDGKPVKGLCTKDFAVWRGMQAWDVDLAVPLDETDMPGIYSLTMRDRLPSSFKGQIAFVVHAHKTIGRTPAKGWGLADLVKL